LVEIAMTRAVDISSSNDQYHFELANISTSKALCLN
jgi:hypothetical protein